jgi:hypothetical protein
MCVRGQGHPFVRNRPVRFLGTQKKGIAEFQIVGAVCTLQPLPYIHNTQTKQESLLSQTAHDNNSLARPTSRCILFDGENIPFDANLVIYIYIYIYI